MKLWWCILSANGFALAYLIECNLPNYYMTQEAKYLSGSYDVISSYFSNCYIVNVFNYYVKPFIADRSYYEIELVETSLNSHTPSLIICLVSCGAHLSAPSSALYYEVLKFTINTQGNSQWLHGIC